MPTYIASVDQGTTSSRFIVFDTLGQIVALHQMEFRQIYPKAGWAEHDPYDILNSVKTCISETVKQMKSKNLNPLDIKAIGITNQRETTIVWDAATGKPLHNAIVWLDTRTKNTVNNLIQKTPTNSNDHYRSICGLPLSTYFSAVKLRWLLDNVKAVHDANENGTLRFGTVDSWLIYNLTGGQKGGTHITDVTNASRTMLMDLKSLDWSDELCRFFGVKKECLPTIKSSSEVYGHMEDGPLKGVPISGCLGDQHAALVGQKCFAEGSAKNTYGTGCFMLFNTGEKPVVSRNGLLTTLGYKFGKNGKAVYALEGSIAIAGAAVKWLRDNLNLISSSDEVGTLAAEVSDTSGVYFVPAFSGLFAPYWRDDARGCIVGLTSYTTKHHICRATLEAVAFQSRAILEAMNKDSGVPLKSLKVDGGLTNSDLCMQLQSDIIGIDVVRPYMRETTALGAAIAAGLAEGVNVFRSIEEVNNVKGSGFDVFKVTIGQDERDKRYGQWQKAVERSFGWVNQSDES
ncbi:hypothetical protein BKA69DRAFT_1154761 [Paraphysoderma sedebokerense]|nr:hypothetical protein BKA69DRAFT_1154761 [Paraphysoderma sedebokerense]